MARCLTLLMMLAPLTAFAQGWGNVGKKKEVVFTWSTWWTEPLF